VSLEWHKEEDMPGFKEGFLRFLAQCEELSYQFIDLIAEALGLEKDSLRIFFDPVMQHRAKVRTDVASCGRILTIS
jgi:isopenicillin N synthase-like dioxygenase